MDATITDQELSMTIPCAFPQRFELLIFAIDKVEEDYKLTVQFCQNSDTTRRTKDRY